MAEKFTKVDYFNQIIEVVGAESELGQFCAKEIALLEKKKNSTSNSNAEKTNAMNECILNLLADGKERTITEMLVSGVFGSEVKSTQAITPYVSALAKAGTIKIIEVKGRKYYSLP